MFGLMLQTCTSVLHILAVLSFWFSFNKGRCVSCLGIRWKEQEAEWHWIMRTAIICTPYQYYYKDEIMENEMGRTHSMHEGPDMAHSFGQKTWRVQTNLKTCVNGIIFKLILKIECDSADWVIWSQTGIKSGICEHGNETSRSVLLVVVKMLSSILAGRFSKWLINHKMLTKFQAALLKETEPTTIFL